MKDLLIKIKEKTWIHYLLLIVIGLLVAIPFLWMQIRPTDDGWLHLIRLIGLDKSIEQGYFPFLVFPYICRNFGYSMTAFYPPIVAYVPYILGLISNSFAIGLKLFATSTIILSGIFMYNLVNEVTKKKGISFLAAIIYMVFPYRLEVIFNRFAIGEFTAFVFMPLVFQGLYNLLNGDQKKHYYIAIGAIGLLLSHTISTVYTALFCVIYILFNFKKFIKKDIIIKCIINVIFILLVSAIFLIPMLEFKSQAVYSIFEPDVMKTSGVYVQNNVIEPWQWLKDKGEENGVSFIVGVPAIFMLAITVLVYKEIDKEYKDFYIINFVLGIISLFMCTKYFPWKLMPDLLCTIQYPWRMVGFALFFFSSVFAINVYHLIHLIRKEKMREILYVIAIIILGIFTATRLTIYQTEDKTIDKNYESSLKENLIISHFSVNRDYMPYKALVKQWEYVQNREDRVYILEGNCNIEKEEKEALNMQFTIKYATQNTVLELPYFFYPGYTVTLDNGTEKIQLETFESENGFLTVQLPQDIEEGKIALEYTGTTIELIAYIILAISLICFIIYIIQYRKKNKIMNKVEESNEG